LPGMLKSLESLAVKPGLRAKTRWALASAIMMATMKRVQLFAQMTMAYRG
jgi:hypothetical protein